jgi:hypothetical protein
MGRVVALRDTELVGGQMYRVKLDSTFLLLGASGNGWYALDQLKPVLQWGYGLS